MTLLSNFLKNFFEQFKGLSVRQWLAIIIALPFMALVGLFQLVRLVFYPYWVLIDWISCGAFLNFSEYWHNNYWENNGL